MKASLMASLINSRLNTFIHNPYTSIVALISTPFVAGSFYTASSLFFQLTITPLQAMAYGATVFIIGAIVEPIFDNLLGNRDEIAIVFTFGASWMVGSVATPFLLSMCGMSISVLTAFELTISSIAFPLFIAGIIFTN
jgi:hypothetical protein